jgi:hypothetical protein
LRGGQDLDLRHRKRLAVERQISSRKRQETDDDRKNRGADCRSFCRALALNGRGCDAGRKTEWFVQFIPHFSRRPSFRTAQARESTLPQPILGDPLKASVSFSPLIRLDAGIFAILERHPTMKQN